MSDFTIRVYAIIEHDEKILFSREEIKGDLFVKFPGGGLEYGEGTRSCLKREIKEETGLEAEILTHFYTTDFFQPSAFHRHNVQVLSIYYLAELIGAHKLPVTDVEREEPGFFWVAKSEVSTELVDLPIDRKVIEMLMK